MDYGDIKKILFKLNPETAHKIAELAMRTSVKIPFVSDYFVDNFCLVDTKLSQNIFGLNFLNPIGIAGRFRQKWHASWITSIHYMMKKSVIM